MRSKPPSNQASPIDAKTKKTKNKKKKQKNKRFIDEKRNQNIFKLLMTQMTVFYHPDEDVLYVTGVGGAGGVCVCGGGGGGGQSCSTGYLPISIKEIENGASQLGNSASAGPDLLLNEFLNKRVDSKSKYIIKQNI